MSSDIGSFTPIPHSLAQEVGLVCAAVYGAVWRKCQMEEGICKASLDTLGLDIHLDRATVMRSIKKLCELGYLTDQTPGRRNAPHTYILSKSVAECNSTSVVMRNSPDESVADDNKSVAHNNSSTEGQAETVAESHLKRVSSLESNPLESIKDNLDSSPYGEGGLPPIPEIEPELEQALPEVQKPAKKSNKDKASLSPAFRIFTEITEYFAVNTHWRNEAARIVGEKPEDLEFWRRVVIGWTGKYPTKHNIQGMLDYYQRREIPGFEHKTYSQQVSESAHYEPPDPIPPPTLSPEEATWQKALSDIKLQIPQWLATDIKAVPKRSNGTFKLIVTTEGAKEWIDNRLKDKIIQPALSRIDHSIQEIEVIVQ